jgi:hypothetical protein
MYTKLQSENLKKENERGMRRWKNNIKMGLKETGCEVIDWVYPAQDRIQWWAFVNTVMNLHVP